MAKAGRKPKLTAATKAEILDVVQEGLSRRRAGDCIGVSHTTIQREAERDPVFRAALKRAEAECERHHVRRIHTGEKTWASSAWFLQRKWPKRYAERKSEEATGSLVDLARSLVAASPPRGTVPSVEQSGSVQDDSRRSPIGQDGIDGQAMAGPLATEATAKPPAVG